MQFAILYNLIKHTINLPKTGLFFVYCMMVAVICTLVARLLHNRK